MRNHIHNHIYTNANLNPMTLVIVMMNTLYDFASGDDHDHKNYNHCAAGVGPLVLAPLAPASLLFPKDGRMGSIFVIICIFILIPIIIVN